MFHNEIIDGKVVYVFKPDKLASFHMANLDNAVLNMSIGIPNVIIDNTNTTWKEIKPYVEAAKELGYDVVLAEPNTSWKFNAEECARRNVHGVPLEACQRMLARWETSYVIRLMVEDIGLKCEIL